MDPNVVLITFPTAIRFLLSMDPNVTLQTGRMFDHFPCKYKASLQYGS